MTGELSPGDRLPSEHAMAEQHSVGRSTVREVMRSLSSEHLVVTRRGVTGGTFVAEPSRDLLSSTLRTGLDLLAANHGLTIDELIEARELLEIPGARLAAQRANTEQVGRIRASIVHTDLEVDPGFELNRQFHRTVLEISGNRLLDLMTSPVFDVLQKRTVRRTVPGGFWQKVTDEHHRIAEAISAGDPDRSGQLMADHLATLRTGYKGMAGE